MKRGKRWHAVIALLLVAGMVLPGCDAPGSEETPTSPPLPAETAGGPVVTQGRCGDGVCDEAEQANPALCPQDCPSPPTAPMAVADTPTLPEQPASRPNIVFILTDDLDYAAIPYMPTLKALIADQGVTLTNFFISMPLCCPSRATILRGQYGHNTEIMGNDLPFGGFSKFYELGEEESTIAVWLQGAGYRTMMIGKYLNAFPDRSDLMHIPAGWTEWYSPVDGDPYTQYDYTLNENGQQVAYGHEPADYGTDVYAAKTLEFIERSVQAGQPFFAHVSLYAPHWPTTPAPRHADLFADAQAPRTPSFDEEDVSDKPSYIRDLPRLTQSDIARIDEEWRNRLRSMQAVDELIEAVVKTLEANGQLENTYLFFTSDNGYHLGNHRQVLGKTAPYEEETRVTMIVRGPGVPAGQTRDHLAGNIDLAPTWAELAGAGLPEFVDGRSLVPLLGNSPPPLSEWRHCFLLEHAPYEAPGRLPAAAASPTNTPEGVMEPPDPEDEYASGTPAALKSGKEALPYRGIRTEDYLYVEYPTGEQELYDLRKDPYQIENIVHSAEPALVEELSARLSELAACAGEECRSIEDKAFSQARPAAQAPAESTPRPITTSDPLIYYLGYATQDNMSWIEAFDVDVLTRGFLLFLNANDAWLSDYRSRMEACQSEGRQFLVAIQAAALVENAQDLPSLGANDPALAFPMEPIPQWEDLACRTPQGSTLKEQGSGFAHACINNADFRALLKERLRALVDSGADGVHIDELVTRYFTRQEGYCDACLEGFRYYLAQKYTAAELASRYSITDVSSFDFRARLADEGHLETPPASPLHREWWLFQLSKLVEVEREILSDCKSYAQSEGREFIVTTNAFEPERNPDRVIEMTMTDFASIGTGMTIMLRQEGAMVSTLRIPPDYSYIPLYRMAQAVTPDKPVTLFIDGPGGTGLMQELPEQTQRDVVRWMFAEAYAAGARFHVPYPSLDYYAPVEECEQYVRFIRDNREAYEGGEHLVDVGVLFSYASEIWDYWTGGSTVEPNHSLQWYGLAQALTDMSIQYDAILAPDGNILPDDLALDDLLAYQTLLVPWAYSLRDEQVALLEAYAESGKQLIVFGDLASVDEEKNARSADPAADLRALGAIVVPGLNFEAYLDDPHGAKAAAVVDALSALLPGRLVAIANSAVTAQLDRKENTLYCHLINKARVESGFEPQADFKVQLTLPSDLDLSDAQALYLSPDLPEGEAALLPLTLQEGVMQVTIPELEIYGLLIIAAAD
jgi:N-acetylglucosamine-6-sulfatase